MPENGDWEGFVRRIWSYQWTRMETPLSDEIVAALRDESQGIIDDRYGFRRTRSKLAGLCNSLARRWPARGGARPNRRRLGTNFIAGHLTIPAK